MTDGPVSASNQDMSRTISGAVRDFGRMPQAWRSPGTVSNLRTNPNVEVNVVDHFVRKGYRFRGTAEVLDSGPDFDRHVEFFSKRGVFDAPGRIRAIVTVRVDQARPLISPGYDHVPDEATARAHWLKYYVGEAGAV